MAAASLAARPRPSGLAAAGARGGGAPLNNSAAHVQAAGSRDAAPAALHLATFTAASGRRRCRPVCSIGGGSNSSPAPSAAGEHLTAAAQLADQLADQPRTSGRQRQRQRQGASAGGRQQSELEQSIQRQRSVEGVLALLEGSEDDIPPAAAAAALYQLSKLGQAGGGGSDARAAVAAHPAVPRLFRVLQQGAADLHIRSLVSVLACCRDLGLRPPRSLPEELADQLVRRLPAVAPAQASNALRDLTRLGSEDGRDSLLAAVNTLVEQQQRELATAAQGAAGQTPLPPWLAQLSATQLTSLLWVCAKAAFRSQPLLHGITQAMLAAGSGGGRRGPQQQQQQQPQPQRHSRSSTRPGQVAAAEQPLPGLGPRQLSSVFYSLGTLRWAPSTEVSRAA